MTPKELTQSLVERVASLNPDAGVIGPGMLASIVHDARVIVAKQRTNIEHVRVMLDKTCTSEDTAEVIERQTKGKWFVSFAAYTEAVRMIQCDG